VKVVISDVPRPKFHLPDIRPGDPLPDLMNSSGRIPTDTIRKSETVFSVCPASARPSHPTTGWHRRGVHWNSAGGRDG